MIANKFSIVLVCLVSSSTLLLAMFSWPSTAVEGGVDVFLRIWHVPTLALELSFVLLVLPFAIIRFGISIGALRFFAASVLFAYVAWRSFSSPYQWAAIYGIGWLIHILFFYALVFSRNFITQRVFESAMLFLVLSVSVNTLLYWTDMVFVRMNSETILPNPVFTNVRHLSYLSAPAIALCTFWVIEGGKWHQIALVGFASAWFYLFLTGGRGGFGAGVFGMLGGILILYGMGRKLSRRCVLVLIGTMVLTFFFAELSPNIRPTLLDRGFVGSTENVTEFAAGRIEVWNWTIDMIALEPWFGNGPAALRHIGDPNPNNWFSQPHSFLLQLLLHWGVVGTMLVIAALLTWKREIFSALSNGFHQCALAVLVCATMIIHALLDGGLFYPFSVAIFLLAMARIVGVGLSTGPLDPRRQKR